MGAPRARLVQISSLLLVSAALLYAAPDVWHFTPDSGMYVGAAESMLREGRFWFNGYPNLLVYPGVPTLLAVPIALFGTNFHVLHVLAAASIVATLWLASGYFSLGRYGWAGAAVPLILACAPISQGQAFLILSDGTFLAITLCTLLLWRIYVERSDRRARWLCFLLVAFAPLVRFQGLFLCAAFTAASALHAREGSPRPLHRVAFATLLGLSTLLPFAVWTLRNFLAFTPDTFNMANSFFFGQKGLSIYAPGFARRDWIDPEWLYGPYRLWHAIRDLAAEIFGSTISRWLGPGPAGAMLCVLVAVGSPRWFRRANGLERVWVLALLASELETLLAGRNLHLVTRYWLPLLPFLALTAAAGLQAVHERLASPWARTLSASLIASIALAIAYDGFCRYQTLISPETRARWVRLNVAVEKAAAFVRERTSQGAAIATTDSGVMPRALQRRSFLVLNDSTHAHTLRRMDRYQTEYLVIVCTGRQAKYALATGARFPRVFEKVFQVSPRGECPAVVYRVDLEALRRLVASYGDPERGEAPAPEPGSARARGA